MSRANLRIAHLTATFPPYPGGAGNTCYRFAKGQAERGHHVEVFTAAVEGQPPDPGGAIVHRIDPVMAVGNAPLIPKLARLESFDVVHLHYPFIFGSELTLLGRRRKRSRGAALVVHYKNRLLGKGTRGLLFETYEHTVAPALIRAADRILVLSPDHARSVPYLAKALDATPERVIEMPNGVDTEAFSPGADDSGLRERIGIPADAVVAAFVATLDRAHHFKRLDVAIEALGRTRSRDIHLLVAGGGELPAVLRASDLFVLTTEPPESFGIVLIEAMACGLPVLATDYPGVRAVVDDDTGILIPAGDSGAAAEALDRLDDMGSDGRGRLGAAGRAKAERLWAWPALLDRMDAAYVEAIAARREKLGAAA